MTTICMNDHAEWEKNRLNVEMENATYINQIESGFGDDKGEWFDVDDDHLIVYTGTFSNDHSPGSSHNTYAEIFEDKAEYSARVKELEGMPEFLESDSNTDDDIMDE